MTTEYATSADGTRIAFVRDGAGPPIILAHGASDDKAGKRDLRQLLCQHHTVVAYDRRGRGESGDHARYDFLKEADDLRAVVSAIGQAPVVFGISMGARAALELLRAPPRLAAMVLFEAPATDTADPVFAERLHQVRAEMTRNGNEAAVILHSRTFHGRSDAEIESLRRDPDRWALRVASFPVTLREMEAVHRDCLFAPAAYIRPDFPVHLLTGDATIPFLQTSATLLSGLAFVTTTVLPGGVHSDPTDNPARIYAAYREAVDST